jgi:hypothetical protein
MSWESSVEVASTGIYDGSLSDPAMGVGLQGVTPGDDEDDGRHPLRMLEIPTLYGPTPT